MMSETGIAEAHQTDNNLQAIVRRHPYQSPAAPQMDCHPQVLPLLLTINQLHHAVALAVLAAALCATQQE